MTKVGETISADQFKKTYGVGATITADQFKKSYGSTGMPTSQPDEVKKSFFQKLTSVGKTVANTLTSSEQTLGKGLSTVFDKGSQREVEQESASRETQIQALTDALHKQTDPNKKAHLIQALKNLGATPEITAADLNEGFNLSDKQVLGAALGTVADVASFGTYGEAAKGAETGELLSKAKPIEGFVTKEVPETIGKITKPTFTEKATTFAKGFLSGTVKNAPIGAVYGASGALQDNKDIKGIIKNTIEGSVFNTILGGFQEGRTELKTKTAPYKAQELHDKAVQQYKVALSATKEKYKEMSDKVIPDLLKEGKWGTRGKLLTDALNGVKLSEQQYADLGKLQGVAEIDGVLGKIDTEQKKLLTPTGKILSTETGKYKALEGLKNDVTEYISAEHSKSGAATQELQATYQTLETQKQKLLNQGLKESNSAVKNLIKSQGIVEDQLNKTIVPVADQQSLRELTQKYGATLYDTRKSLKTISDNETLSQVQKVDGMIRDLLAKNNPTYADINKIYTQNSRMVDILNETANRESSGLGTHLTRDLIAAVGGGSLGAIHGIPGIVAGSLVVGGLTETLQSTWWNSLRAVQKEKAAQKLLNYDPEKRNQIIVALGRQGVKYAQKIGLLK